MPVDLRATLIVASGEVDGEDAVLISEWLAAGTASEVDLRRVTHVHAAALQALLHGRPLLRAAPTDPVLRQQVRGLPRR